MSDTVYIALDALRECALERCDDLETDAATFDREVGRYLDYVRAELASEGFGLEVEHGLAGRSYRIDCADRARADWGQQMMAYHVREFWEWIN